VFVLSLSSFIHILFRKLTGATFPDPKEAGIGKQIALASDYNAQTTN
jgi:hypothetical protein